MDIKVCKEIKKGWSEDKKYYIQSADDTEYLLRVASIEQRKRKEEEFKWMEKAYALEINMPKPIECNIVEDEVHSLFTWVSGADAETVLPTLSKEVQYKLGVESGQILKKLHTLSAPKETESWENSYNRKIDRNINNYTASDIKYEKGHLFLEVVEKNRYLINNRPLTFQHGDYHTGNMILSENNELGIIDFNRWSYGDPWEEFNRIDFTAAASPLFAIGQLDGYFSGEPPLEFFECLRLYISTNTLNALPWAQSYSNQEVETMRRKASAVLEWYDNMQEIIPNWYDKNAGAKYVKK